MNAKSLYLMAAVLCLYMKVKAAGPIDKNDVFASQLNAGWEQIHKDQLSSSEVLRNKALMPSALMIRRIHDWDLAYQLLEKVVQHILAANHLDPKIFGPLEIDCFGLKSYVTSYTAFDNRPRHIVLSPDTIKSFQDDSELAFLLGHEIAHIARHHPPPKRHELWIEAEADRYGLKFITQAGYDPESAARWFERKDKEDKKLGFRGIDTVHLPYYRRAGLVRDNLQELRAIKSETAPIAVLDEIKRLMND